LASTAVLFEEPFEQHLFKSSWQPITALLSDRKEVVGIDNTAAIDVVQEVAPIHGLPTVCLDLVLIG